MANARRRARAREWLDRPDVGAEAERRLDPTELAARLAWRYRSELAPVWAVALLLSLASLAHDYAAAAWLLALPLGAAATAAAWRWEADRGVERVYVLAVGGFATLWTAAAWWASPWHSPLLLGLLGGGLVAAGPWWWHRRRRDRVEFAARPPRRRLVKRELRRLRRDWPGLAYSAELIGSRIQRTLADEHGYTLVLALRPGQTVADVVSRIARLESVLKTRPGAVQVAPDPARADRCYVRVVHHDPLAKPIAWPGPSGESIGQPLRVGVFGDDGELVELELVGEHLLIGGSTGRGKSGLANVIVAELAARGDVVLWGVDCKGGLELAPWRPVLERLAASPQEGAELLRAANRALDARARLMVERGQRKWQPSPQQPALVVLVDELAELAGEAMAGFERLARLGRACGIVLVAATQRPSAAALGSLDARTQLTVRVCLGVIEARDVDMILGQGRLGAGWRAERLGPPGSFLVLAPSRHETPRPARAYWLSDEAVAAAAERFAEGRPGLDAATAAAAEQPSDPLRLLPESAESGGGGEPGAGIEALPEDLDEALALVLQRASAEGLSPDELAELVGWSRSSVYARLPVLEAAGRAHKVGRGRWRGAEPATTKPQEVER